MTQRNLAFARLLIAATALAGSGVSRAVSEAADFDLRELPHGKEVTLNRPATTRIPMADRVKLSATGSPQTLSFTVEPAGGKAIPIRLAVFDVHQDTVRYLKVVPGHAALYAFKGISSIFVVPSPDPAVTSGGQASAPSTLYLQVASDKPLTIAH